MGVSKDVNEHDIKVASSVPMKVRSARKVKSTLGNYIVVNDTVENAADKIMAIIRAEHAKTRRTITEYMKMVEDR